MSTMTFNTLRAYKALEPRLGAESADALVSAIDDAFTELSSRHNGTLLLKKSKIREELRIEMKDELATKADMAKLQADMASLRGEIQADLAKLQGYVDARFEQVNTRFERLDKKFTLMFGVLVFLIIFLNQNALEFILKVVGILK